MYLEYLFEYNEKKYYLQRIFSKIGSFIVVLRDLKYYQSIFGRGENTKTGGKIGTKCIVNVKWYLSEISEDVVVVNPNSGAIHSRFDFNIS